MHKGKAAPHQRVIVILDVTIEIIMIIPKEVVKKNQTAQIVNVIARTNIV